MPFVITCLPMMYKLLTGIIAEDLYSHIEDGRKVRERRTRSFDFGRDFDMYTVTT